MGALCVTYCVGGLSVCNSIAGAYAEKSPVVMITGSPGLRERVHNPLLHHMVRNFRTQYDVFEKLTRRRHRAERSAHRVQRNRPRAGHVRPLQAARVYRNPARHGPRAARDVRRPTNNPKYAAIRERWPRRSTKRSNASKTRASPCCCSASKSIASACKRKPCELAEESGIPMAATMLGKGVVAETHPLYMGLYEGALGHDEVTKYVEASDCVIMLGTFMTDINLGIYTAELDLGDCIYVTSEAVPRALSSLPRRAAGRFRAHAGRSPPATQRLRRRPRRPTFERSRSRCGRTTRSRSRG